MKKYGIYNDQVFKILFDSPNEQSKRILKSLLEAILNRKIVELNYYNKEIKNENVESKSIISDIAVVFENGEMASIEMQNARHPGIEKRLVFYASRYYSSQDAKGELYVQLKHVYEIILLNDIFYEEDPEYFQDFIFQTRSFRHVIEDIELYLIELPKVEYKEEMSVLEKWLYIIRNYTNESKQDIIKKMIQESEDFQVMSTMYNGISNERWEAIHKIQLEKEETVNKIILGEMINEAEEKGKIEERTEMIHAMYAEGFPIEMIARITKTDVLYVQSILKG